MRITLETFCPMCGKLSHVIVKEVDFFAWQSGVLAQDAFPYLSAEERELLISHLCPDCWNKITSCEKWWSEEKEEEEEEYWLDLDEAEEEDW